MSPATRRSNGCWTCTLRRKKCDERPASCYSCETRGIPCYGYSQKPDWMDGGELERRKAAEIGALVKARNDSMRRGRAIQALQRRLSTPESSSFDTPQEDGGCQLPKKDENALSASPLSASTPVSCQPDLDTSNPDELWEDRIFVNYLEQVLPAQLRYYSFPADRDNRHWHQHVWNQTEPLYSAVLSLRRYYQYIPFHDCVVSISGRRSLDNCIKVLSEKDGRRGPNDNVDILARIIPLQLLLLDVLKGSSGGLHMYLHAMLNLTPTLHPSSEVETEPNSSSCEKQPRGRTEPSELCLLSTSNLTLEIFTGVTLWLDILSCASTGLGPCHSQLCIAALTEENSKVQLQDLMGCENWAMLLIREIAILKVSRDQASSQQDQEDLQRRAADIEQRLEAGLRKTAKPYVELTEYSESARTTEMSRQIEIKGITQFMALAAFIYLHVSVHGSGPQSLPVAGELLFRWMFNIRFMTDSRVVPYLLWPICIAGCMATTPLQEQYFRDIVADEVADGKSSDTWLYVLQVMELCWKMRRTEGKDSEGWDWERAMRVQGRIVLLV